MNDQIRSALRRAAKGSPLFAHMGLYSQAVGDDGRNISQTFDWMCDADVCIRWKDVETRTNLDDVGDGIATIIANDTSFVPDLLLATDGTFYAVGRSEGQDSLKAGQRVRVRVWDGDLPKIREDTP